jgi:hypothetical protein
MAVIVLRNDVDWFAAGWILRYVAEKLQVGLKIPRLDEKIATAERGFQYLDLSDLDESEQDSLRRTVSSIVSGVRNAGPSSIADPAFYDGLLERLEELERLVAADRAA